MNTDPTGLEWGCIRDFAKDVNYYLFWIYNEDPVYDFSQSGKVRITLGSGYFYRIACFHLDGNVKFTNRNHSWTEKVAKNVNGKLYLERTDFLRAFGIPYVQYEQQFTVTWLENKVKTVTVGALVTLLTAPFKPVIGFIIGSASDLGVEALQFDPGEYIVRYTIAEIKHPGLGVTYDTWRAMMTVEYYRKEVNYYGQDTWVVARKPKSIGLDEYTQSIL